MMSGRLYGVHSGRSQGKEFHLMACSEFSLSVGDSAGIDIRRLATCDLLVSFIYLYIYILFIQPLASLKII